MLSIVQNYGFSIRKENISSIYCYNPRDKGIGLSSFPPSPDPTLGGTHWNDDDESIAIMG